MMPTMSSLAQLAASYTLITVLGLAAGAAATGTAFRILRAELRHIEPTSRIPILLALHLAPPLTALLLAVSMSAPWSALGADSWAHCASHAGVDGSLCGWHPPQLDLPIWLTSLLLLVALFAMLSAFAGIRRLATAAARLSMIRGLARRTHHGHYLSLPTSQPLAFAAGFVRARIFISNGLERALSDAQMRIVIAHERTHTRRFDMAVTMAADALSRFQWPKVGKALRSEWRLAIEQRCDEIVAAETGNRADVAACLVQVARLQGAQATCTNRMTCRLLDSDLTARVTALLDPPANRRPDLLIRFGLLHLVAAALVLLTGAHLHRWAELLLSVSS